MLSPRSPLGWSAGASSSKPLGPFGRHVHGLLILVGNWVEKGPRAWCHEVTWDNATSCSVLTTMSDGGQQRTQGLIRLHAGNVSWGKHYILDYNASMGDTICWRSNLVHGRDFTWQRQVRNIHIQDTPTLQSQSKPAQQPLLCEVLQTFDWTAWGSEYLAVQRGDRVLYIQDYVFDCRWAKVSDDIGREGWVPKNFLERVPSSATTAPPGAWPSGNQADAHGGAQFLPHVSAVSLSMGQISFALCVLHGSGRPGLFCMAINIFKCFSRQAISDCPATQDPFLRGQFAALGGSWRNARLWYRVGEVERNDSTRVSAVGVGFNKLQCRRALHLAMALTLALEKPAEANEGLPPHCFWELTRQARAAMSVTVP